MKKSIYAVSICITLTTTLAAQSIERQVFNSFGKVSQANGITLSSNVGEPITQTYYSANNRLTQGFLQPDSKDLTMDFSESGNTSSSVQVWPNPTVEGLFISYENISTSTGHLMVYDMAGKCLLTESICAGCTQQYLSLPSLADGIYVIRVALSDQVFQDKKFIKVSQ